MLKNRRTVHLKFVVGCQISFFLILFSFFLDRGNSQPWPTYFPGLSYYSLYLSCGEGIVVSATASGG